MPGHFVGTPVTGASVPILGWSLEVGDLRVPHFLATHAMHAVPAFALLFAWFLRPVPALRATVALTAIYPALVAFAFRSGPRGPSLPVVNPRR